MARRYAYDEIVDAARAAFGKHFRSIETRGRVYWLVRVDGERFDHDRLGSTKAEALATIKRLADEGR